MGGGKGGGAPPIPPDFVGAARAQGQMGQQNVREATIANRPDIKTPFGFQRWTQTPIAGSSGGKGDAAGGSPPGFDQGQAASSGGKGGGGLGKLDPIGSVLPGPHQAILGIGR